MIPVERDRLSLVTALLELSEPLQQLAEKLSSFSWDYEGSPVVLARAHIDSALDRYLTGRLSGQQLEDWANLIEGRDDVSAEPCFEQVIQDVIHQLANPELTSSLTFEKAGEFRRRLAE